MADVVSRVVRVELFEDRASVVREIVLGAVGRSTVEVTGLSPLVRARTLSFDVNDAADVEDVKVERWLAHHRDVDPEQVKTLTARRDAAQDAYADAASVQARADDRAARTDDAAEAALAWFPRALVQADDPAGWAVALRRLAEAHLEAVLADADAAKGLERADQALSWSRAQLERARLGSTAWRARARLRVNVRRAGAVLRMRYTVPCALWRPVHRATLRGDGLQWEVGAMAWNATGEAWQDVALVCSTERPGRTPTAPQLTDDVVRTHPRAQEVVVEARDETIEVARQGEARSATEALGVDDGGEPRVFTAPRPVILPSDGRPIHVALEAWATPAQRAWIGHPERSAAVVLRTRQENAGARPLLAGPVTLLRESGAVGTGRIGYVPAGEPFDLGWGSHDAVRVSRRQDHQAETAAITGKQTHSFEVVLRVSNVGDEALEVTLRERLPVSELREVTVAKPRATPALAEGPDGDGFCTWKVALAARTTERLTLAYTVTASSRVRLPW